MQRTRMYDFGCLYLQFRDSYGHRQVKSVPALVCDYLDKSAHAFQF